MPIYQEYKSLTAIFVKWIIKTAGKINPLSKDLPNTITNLSRRAELISGCDTIFPFLMEDDCLPILEDVLLDGHKAIKLRKLMNKLYLKASLQSGKVNESDERHAHFVVVLESMHSKIKVWYNKLAIQLNSASETDEIGNRASATNIFSVLSDESFTEDEEDLDDLCAPMDSSSIIDVDRSAFGDLNVDEIDEDEEKVKTIVLCFVIDVVALMRKVENAWRQVVDDSMHVVVAVSISVTAIQALDRQFAELQSQLPSIDDATTFLISICDSIISSEQIGDCELSKFYEQMMMYLKILRKFAHTILQNVELDGRLWATHNLPEDRIRFIEQYSPLAMTPSGIEEFIFVQLCLLHRKMNILAAQQLTLEDIYINFPSSKMFLCSFYSFFQTKVVSVALLLRCMIWVQIISVLQDTDELRMSRTIYIMRKYCRRVIQLLSPDEEVLCYSAHLPPCGAREIFIDDNVNINLDDNYKLFHHNPLLQGMHLLDLIIQNEAGMSRTLLSNGFSLLRLYSAMKKEGLVTKEIFDIPIIDLLLCTVDRSREFVTELSRGSYLSSFLREIEQEANSMKEYFCPTRRRRNRRGRSSVRVYSSGKKILSTAGALYFFLFEQDLSTLDGEKPSSSSELVETIAQIVTEGSFNKRTLSLSAVKFGRIFNGVYLRIASMFPELVESAHSTGMYPRNGICKDPPKVSALAGTCKTEINSRIFEQLDKIDNLSEEKLRKLRNMCERIGAIIVDTLKPIDLERELYIFKPDEKDAFSREFGELPVLNLIDRETHSNPMYQIILQMSSGVFADVQAQFERFLSRPAIEIGNRKIQNAFIDSLKTIIKGSPGCLQHTNLRNAHFATIFDYVVCVLKNMDFAEWIVQMRGFLPRGAQFLRLTHGEVAGGLDQTHLQNACQHQVAWAIDFILAVSQGIDRNFGFVGNNTALHYIVRMGDPFYVISFMEYGSFANLGTNNDDKGPFDLAETREMKDFLKSSGIYIKKCELDVHNSHQRRIYEKASIDTGRELDAFRTQSSSARRNARKDASALSAVSSEDVARAERAEKELLELLDAEEAAQKDGTKKKSSKKSGNTRAKKK